MLRSNIVPILAVLALANAPTCLGQLGVTRQLFVMGGRSDYNPETYPAFVEAAGGQGVARIGIVSAASGTPVQSGHAYEEVWDNMGAAETYWIPVHMANKSAAFDPEVVENALRMTGFYFSGGDQSRLTATLFDNDRFDTPVLSAIRSRYESGEAAVGGDSAGATALTGAVMPLSGESYNALLSGANAEETNNGNDLVYDPYGGLGFLPDFVLDTHFT